MTIDKSTNGNNMNSQAPPVLTQRQLCSSEFSDNIVSLLPSNIKPCISYDGNFNELNHTITSSSFTFLHLNISSLQKHVNELVEMLHYLTIKPSVICLSEIRIGKEPSTNIEIPGYKYEFFSSPTVIGGVAIYILSNIKYKVIDFFKLSVTKVEELWLEIEIRNCASSTKRVIGCIYRHPNQNNLEVFLNKINISLSLLNEKQKQYYILGDFNINTLSSNIETNASNKYKFVLKSNGCFSVITTPTRETPHSKTLIDHILTNETTHLIKPGVIEYKISDHHLTFVSITACNKSENNKRVSKYTSKYIIRQLKAFNSSEFCQELRSKLDQYLNQCLPIDSNNFNYEFDKFHETILQVINKHAPFKNVTRKQQKLLLKPWITKGLYVSIGNKQRLYRSHFKSGDASKMLFFKKYANKLTHLKEISKKLFYGNEVKNSKLDPKKLWKTLHSLLPWKKKKNSDMPSSININGNNLENSNDIAEAFNDYFINVGQSLAGKFKNTSMGACAKYLKCCNKNTIFLFPPTNNEIFNIINSLKSKMSTKDKNIPSFFVKLAANLLSPYLNIFFSYVFQLGIFPNSLKIASVTPIYKSNDRNEVSNYRPISVLPCLSKILEKLIKTRITKFFDLHNLFYHNQYGFRSKHSTIHAILKLTSSLYDSMNNKKYSCLVFIDLKKAFDTVCHQRLLLKLNHYGIRGVALELLSSYLNNRMQYVNINGTSSSCKYNTYGVPQGSVLGPLLYLIYVNDLPNSLNSTPILYADDTCVLVEGSTLEELEIKINSEMNKISQWMQANLLTINTNKTSIMVLQPTIPKEISTIHLKINNVSISNCNSVKYLGILIIKNLTFRP